MALNNFLPEADVYQFGKETTRGTAVPATEKMAISMLNVDEAGQRYLPQYAVGILRANRGHGTVVSRQSTWEIPDTAFNYEQHHRFLGMAIAGSVAPTGSNPYTRVFSRSLTADPNPDAYTIERRRSDGTTHEDIELPYSLISQLRYTFGQNGALMWGATGFSRKVAASTLTAALSMPTPELVPSALVTAYMDDSWDDLGDTQLALQLLGGTVTIATGLFPYQTMDGRADLDFATHLLNAGAVKATVALRVLMKPGQLAIERAAAAAQTIRALRLHAAGSGSREFTLDLLLSYPLPDILAAEVSDGQYVANLNLETEPDLVNPDITATLINTIAA